MFQKIKDYIVYKDNIYFLKCKRNLAAIHDSETKKILFKYKINEKFVIKTVKNATNFEIDNDDNLYLVRNININGDEGIYAIISADITNKKSMLVSALVEVYGVDEEFFQLKGLEILLLTQNIIRETKKKMLATMYLINHQF